MSKSLKVSKTEVSLLTMRTNSTKSSISWFLRKGNDYIIIHLKQWRERCKINQSIGRAESFSQGAETIGAGKGYSTRELLTKLGAYGYGHKLLLQADKLGLVDRKTVKNKVFNTLTSEGKKLVNLAKEVGV